jgi:predicted lipoprotein with Yx(FWY)xxD motif
MTRWSNLVVVIGLIAGPGLPLPASQAQTVAPRTLTTAEHPEHGGHLTDRAGMSLYLFEEDRPEGERGRSAESDCTGECLDRWPPLLVEGAPAAEGGADASLTGFFRRPDGKIQATYNGWPLYYFADDFLPGDTNGHDFEEFGGEWYLLTPAGHALGQDLDDDKRNRRDKSGRG